MIQYKVGKQIITGVVKMDSYAIFKDIAIILVAAKLCGILARKVKAPQVVGEIVAGLLIGPCLLGWVAQSDFISQMAEIGVIILMFSAGLETDIKDLLKTGPVAFAIACMGVLVPLVGGTLLYMVFYGFSPIGSDEFYKALFTGTILTATSVSITVQALREMGHLKGKIGTTIVSAAVIDDVIGIIVLTFVIGLKTPDSSVGKVVINTVMFFAVSGIGGVIAYKLFKLFDAKYPHTRRIPIIGLALCLFMAYAAETFFGIADITGAYVAGIILCSIRDSDYIAEKMDINSYMIFGPLFFASIGLKTNIESFNMSILVFSIAFVILGMITKIIGCGLAAKLCGNSWLDSAKVGVGMMARGEVALIVSQKGLAVGMLSPVYFTAVILLIIVSSILSPILLKYLYARQNVQSE